MTLRVVFAGTPDFSVPTLQALLDHDFEVVAVFTQPDRPAGRGRKLSPSPVKRLASEHGIPVFQPKTLQGQAPALRSLACDVMVVVAYGLLLPPEILAVPRLGCVNVHASLLPRWRGAAPIQRAVEAGDAMTGVTIMQMDKGLDTGPILATRQTPISDLDTAGILHDRLAELGAALLIESLRELADGRSRPRAQEAAHATIAPKLRKQEANIDWRRPAAQICRKIKAFNPWPVAQTRLRGQRIRVWDAIVGNHGQCTAAPGTVHRVDERGIEVICGTGVLVLTELQRDGGKRLPVREFVNGYPVAVDEQFDDIEGH